MKEKRIDRSDGYKGSSRQQSLNRNDLARRRLRMGHMRPSGRPPTSLLIRRLD
jgi:hypothetical protein